MTAIPTEKIERLEEMTTESLEKARTAVNKTLDAANQKIADAAEKLRETAEADGEEAGMLHKVKDVAREKGVLLQNKARESYGQVKGTASDLGARAKLFVRENPVTSTAVAMGLVLVTGLAIRQARS